MMEAKLKPCPFCGGKAHIDKEDIFCDCGARIMIEPFYYEQPINMKISYRWEKAREEAIEAWNRRESEKCMYR